MTDLKQQRVVAVVLHYNAVETLFQVINGIKSQSRNVDKIVIVDNASETNLSEHFHSDQLVHFVRLPNNKGVGAGHNHGWKIAITDFAADLVWSLEHDAVPKPDCLEKLLAHYQPGVLAAIGPIEDDGLDYAHKNYYVFHSLGFRKLTDRKKKDVYKGGMSFNGVLIPVGLLHQVGFLNEDFFVGREDFDFFRRIYKAGGYVLRVPQAQVFHNLYKENRHISFLNKVILFPNQSVTREFYSYRNSVYMSKHQNVSGRRLYFRHISGILITLLFRDSKLTRVRNRIKAFKDGLEGRLGK